MHTHTLANRRGTHVFLGARHGRNKRRTLAGRRADGHHDSAEVIGGQIYGSMALVAAAIQPSIAEKGRGHEEECQLLEQFLAALKTAWKDGTARPTEQPTPLSAVGGVAQGSVCELVARNLDGGWKRSLTSPLVNCLNGLR